MTNPFAVLGLPESSELSDDDVRSAWRRVATATHPDRADGGDLARYAEAAAAHWALRTVSARGEALADLRRVTDGSPPAGHVPVPVNPLARAVLRAAIRIRPARPLRLAARLLAAGGASVLAVLAVGWQPASWAVVTGACTWLAVAGRSDLRR